MTQDLTPLRNMVRVAMISKVANFAVSEDGFMRFCTPMFDKNAAIKALEAAQSSDFSQKTGTGKPAAEPVRSYASQSNPLPYEVRHEFEAHRLLDMPRLAAEIATKAWDAAWNHINLEAFNLLFNGRSTAHPENGVPGSGYAAVGGGTVNAVDNFAMTFLDGATANQTNDHTLALSSANISTVLAKRRTFKGPGGKVVRLPKPPFLLCAPPLETLSKDLVKQVGRFYTGSGAESGYAGRIADVIVAPGDTPSIADDAWGLLWTEETTNLEGKTEMAGPIAAHVREAPWVKIDELEGTTDISVLCSVNYDVFYRTAVEQLWFYSEP